MGCNLQDLFLMLHLLFFVSFVFCLTLYLGFIIHPYLISKCFICSLCNTSATSKQTLLLHAEGKKHRAKARAFHAAKQPKQTEPADCGVEVSSDNNQKSEIPENKAGEELKGQNSKEAENDNSHSNKKRKDRESENGGAKLSAELDNGEAIQIEKEQETKHKKKAKNETVKQDKAVVDGSNGNSSKKKMKWKKLITSALKSVCVLSFSSLICNFTFIYIFQLFYHMFLHEHFFLFETRVFMYHII